MKDHILSVDLGGTNMRAAVVDPSGVVVLRMKEPTPRDAPTPVALDHLIDAVRDRGGGRGSFSSVVVGVPGRVDYCRGRLEHAPNLPPAWHDDLNEASLSSHFDVPVRLANDADLATVGEAYFGAGRPFTDVAYVTISTGIGAGVVLDGRLLRGTRSLAEIGHSIIALDRLDRDEDGTAERLGAGPALARYGAEEGLEVEGSDLVALVHAGDKAAERAWERVTSVIAAVAVNLAHLFSPDAIVIGGGVGRNGELVLTPARAALARHGPRNLPTPIALVESTLGDNPGLIGAAAWERAVGPS